MNFQYLQCLDLWNPKYIDCFEDKSMIDYDILDSNNDGRIIKLAKYTTSLFEKIILKNVQSFQNLTTEEKEIIASRYLLAHSYEFLNKPLAAIDEYLKLKESPA